MIFGQANPTGIKRTTYELNDNGLSMHNSTGQHKEKGRKQ